MTAPLVSCLMVTRDRARLAARALRCLAAQTWPRLELVVVDDGDEDYEPVLAPLRARMAVRYVRRAVDPALRLGGLRNLALDLAGGDLCAQWDDDEWYHPDRIAAQVRALQARDAIACVLKWTLMHVDTQELGGLPYRADAGHGTPGTIIHRRTAVRYPNLSRSEDARFLDALRERGHVEVMGKDASHLFIRCFHGANTWDERHFYRRLRRTPRGALHWLVAWLKGDLSSHPQLQLTDVEQRSVAEFLADSRALELLRWRARPRPEEARPSPS
ncbi:MAG: glycosyltransferase family 2 protein [Deltaproteobacteria bacterium]|nr:glycosyltransferase family 2 protein [Deltaproteobacteria bacterium]